MSTKGFSFVVIAVWALVLLGCRFTPVENIPLDKSRDGKIHFAAAQRTTPEVTLPVVYARPPATVSGNPVKFLPGEAREEHVTPTTQEKPPPFGKWRWFGIGLLSVTWVILASQNEKLRQRNETLAQLRKEHDECLAHEEAAILKSSGYHGGW